MVAVAISALLIAASWFTPGALRPLYALVSMLTMPIGLVIGELALFAIFVGVFVPIGWLFACSKRDRLQRKLERQRLSYWEAADAEPSQRSYLRRY